MNFPLSTSSGIEVVKAFEPTVFAEIHRPGVNLAIWQRALSRPLQRSITAIQESQIELKIRATVRRASILRDVSLAMGLSEFDPLCLDISLSVERFCDYLAQDKVFLKFSTITEVMCPRFHADHVQCRLISTYQGSGTQWLANGDVDRSKLGMGSNGLADQNSGLIRNHATIYSLSVGDVALFKGNRWPGFENQGIIHRSPDVVPDTPRLILTLDMLV